MQPYINPQAIIKQTNNRILIVPPSPKNDVLNVAPILSDHNFDAVSGVDAVVANL